MPPFVEGLVKVSSLGDRSPLWLFLTQPMTGQATYPVAILPFLDELPNNLLRDIPT